MVSLMKPDDVQEHWQRLSSRLISGRHPEVGDPIDASVRVSVFEEHGAHDEAFYRRLERARVAANGTRIVALGYEQGPDGAIVAGEGFVLDSDPASLSDDGQPGFARPSASLDVSAARAVATSLAAAGWQHGWAVNGLAFAFCDDTARWCVLTVVDVQVVACDIELLPSLFGGWSEARAAQESFRERFDHADILPNFRAMVGYSRLPM